jgi:hypothetical protein
MTRLALTLTIVAAWCAMIPVALGAAALLASYWGAH